MNQLRRLNRRSFLITSTAGLAAPFFLPSHVWSSDVPPNDRITMGFIGVGTQGRGLLDGFLKKKVTQVLAVSDVDTTRR